jgi:hypothetical protein
MISFEIKETLFRKGFRTITVWARSHGFNPHVVIKHLNRYSTNTIKTTSPQVYKILSQLYLDTWINLMQPQEQAEEKSDSANF